jgi:glycosyltransferase involved in cell wall biosynthesis
MNICIITTHHASYNPRVVKEADALSEAGYEVTVVAVRNNQQQYAFDRQLMATRLWKLLTVNYRPTIGPEGLRWALTGLRQGVLLNLFSRFSPDRGFAEAAHERVHAELTRLALRCPADLYIAHHVQALGAAFAAASHYRARLAFDAEDFHSGELQAEMTSAAKRRIELLEARYLPLCDYVTAGSEDIALAMTRKYGIPAPTTILNVFPLEPITGQKGNCGTEGGGPVSLYWYSQVIGPGRGLEEAVLGASTIGSPLQVHLRGDVLPGFDHVLKTIASRSGGACSLHFHRPISPEHLAQDASGHDIGLALETGDCENRLLCLTNKLFVYMLAGLALIATDTPGQRRIMELVPDTGFLCRMRDPVSFATALKEFLDNPARLRSAQRASHFAAERIYNWNIEKQKLVETVEACLRRPPRIAGTGSISRQTSIQATI